MQKMFSYDYKKLLNKRYSDKLSHGEIKHIIEQQFVRITGYKLDLYNPTSFNEKIQWLKLYYKDSLVTKCSDKYLVREYVKEKIGEEYLVPLLGVWDNADEIDFDSLPNKFVLKVNWGSGQNIICKDKSTLDIKECTEKLKEWIKKENNHYYNFMEWAYKDIKPKIIAEKYIEESEGKLPDYKFFCFNGEPKIVFIAKDREKGKDKLSVTFFDACFNRLPFKRHYPAYDGEIKKPQHFEKMIELSKILAEPFPFVRVDFYETSGELKFGELTFYPGNGTELFYPEEWDYKFGEMLELPKIKKNPLRNVFLFILKPFLPLLSAVVSKEKIKQLKKETKDNKKYIKNKIKEFKLSIINKFEILKEERQIEKRCNNYYKLKNKKNKKVIYTCISGNYDNLVIHKTLNSEYDYICFTDIKELLERKVHGVWQIRPLAFSQVDNTRVSRWHKTHPHEILPEYDESIWVDGNVDFITPKVFKYIDNSSNEPILIPKHFARNCIYEEAKECIITRKDNSEIINEEIKLFKSEGFPKNFGLHETNIIYRKHNDKQCIKIMNEWWDMIAKYSKRDQLSYSYVLWKNKVPIKYLTQKNPRFDNKNFEFFFHK